MSDSDVESLWQELRQKNNKGSMIVAVVRPDQAKEVKRVVKQKNRKAKDEDKLSESRLVALPPTCKFQVVVTSSSRDWFWKKS